MPVLANQPATTLTPVQLPEIGFSQFILPLLAAQAVRGFSLLKTRNQLFGMPIGSFVGLTHTAHRWQLGLIMSQA